jgi:nitrite reductase/ring-hydroxylating ferredoxin subunit
VSKRVGERPGERHPVARVADVSPGERLVMEVAGRSIGVFNVNGTFHALRNRCPHQGAQLCLGPLTALVTADRPGEVRVERDGEILRCPWHGWEFDIATGESVCDPQGMRVKRYPVDVERLQAERYPVEIEEDVIVVYITR